MKLKRLVFIFIGVILSFNVFAENNIPMLFQLNWGASLNEVHAQITQKDIGLKKLYYYSTLKNKDEMVDLNLSSFIKYSTMGSPFFNIPAEIIFTFYNPYNNKNKLKLSKIEVYLQRKDNDNIWVDIKSVYKNLIRIFLDNYDMNLKYSQERNIFRNYDYQVTVNGIYVNFIANIGENILDKKQSIFISYESNKYQNLILKKARQMEIESDIPETDQEKMLKNTKDNL